MQLSHLFSLDFEKVISKELSLSEIASTVGGRLERTAGDGEYIDLTNNNSPPSTAARIIKYYCFTRYVTNVQNYVNEFSYGGNISNITNLTAAVEEAFEVCPGVNPEFELCNNCKDPVCIIDNLSENLSISDYEETVIKANYLRLLVGLEDEEYNLFIAGEHSTFVEDLYNLFSDESVCTNKEKIIEAFRNENCNQSTQTNEEYTTCLLNSLGNSYSIRR